MEEASKYLCEYGAAYAFEYSLIYQIVFKDMYNHSNKSKLIEPSILCLGCGSMIGLWGAKYAIAKLAAKGINNIALGEFHGFDLVDWPIKLIDVPTHIGDITGKEKESCFGSGKTINQNIIFFSKILNELEYDAIDNMFNLIGETDFPNDEYYICFSLNYSGVVNYDNDSNSNALKLSGRIVEAVKKRLESTHGKDYVINSDILGEERNNTFLKEFFDNQGITDSLECKTVKFSDEINSTGYYFKAASNDKKPEENLRNSVAQYDLSFRIQVYDNDENGIITQNIITLPQYFFKQFGDEVKANSNIVSNSNIKYPMNYPVGNLTFQIVKISPKP